MVLGIEADGVVSTTRQLQYSDVTGFHDACSPCASATISLDGESSATLACPDCQLPGNGEEADPFEVRASLSATNTAGVSTSFSGEKETITFTAAGGAHANISPKESQAVLSADASVSTQCGFTVVDHAETISISYSLSGSGKGTAQVLLTGAGGFLNSYSTNFATGETSGAIPSNISLAPGTYSVRLLADLSVSANRAGTSADATNSVSLSVTVPAAEFHWKNPASGNFGTATNCTIKKGRLEVRGGSQNTFSGMGIGALTIGADGATGTLVIENGGGIFSSGAVELHGPSSITLSGVGVSSLNGFTRSILQTADNLTVLGGSNAAIEIKDGALLLSASQSCHRRT